VVCNVEAARKADTLALVVKPQDMGDLLDEIAAELRPASSSSRWPPASPPRSSSRGCPRASPSSG
jgi:hypothetical protein